MILALIIIALAFVWLLIETDFMRVRLPVGKIDLTTPEPMTEVKSVIIPQFNHKPSIFEALDMPATTGNINIVCVRE